MKHIIKGLVLIFVLLPKYNSAGQESKIKEIKKHYYKVSQQIAECEKGTPDACSIYKNDLIINTNG